MSTKKGHADIFDWLYIHDYSLFAKSLEHKLEDFFERKDFFTLKGKATKTIFNTQYCMEWNHLFNSSDCPKVQDLTEDELDLAFPSLKEKINLYQQNSTKLCTLYHIQTQDLILKLLFKLEML